MNAKNLLTDSSSLNHEGSSSTTGSNEVARFVTFSTRDILDTHGEIDFAALIEFLERNDISMQIFFNKEENIKKILFPFFDFLKFSFSSKNRNLPSNIVDILSNNVSVRDGIILYIQERNPTILSTQHIEQYDAIDFHLSLLGMSQDFDLVKDMQSDHFIKIKDLFSDCTFKICRTIGIMDVSIKNNLSESIIRELSLCIQLGETINQLALIHAANFEERQISFELGEIIRDRINPLVKQLNADFIHDHIIGKKLRNLSGKVQCNFAHGVLIHGATPREIDVQVSGIKKQQQDGFNYQREADFGQDTSPGQTLKETIEKKKKYAQEKDISELVLLGNQTIVELMGIERTELMSSNIPTKTSKNKSGLLDNLIHIYNHGREVVFSTREEVIFDFIQGGARNEFAIEVIYYIVRFDASVKDDSLVRLMEFFLDKNSTKINNFFYEEFVIKIISQIIRKFHSSSNSLMFLPLLEKVYPFLKEKNISHSVMSYSKVYLSLALYFIGCKNEPQSEDAKRCFFHYKNLSSSLGSDKNLKNMQDEKVFFTTLGGLNEFRLYGKHVHYNEQLEMAGIRIFEEIKEKYQQMEILSLEAELRKLGEMISESDKVLDQNTINELTGGMIARTIFYQLCTITITGDYMKHSQEPEVSISGTRVPFLDASTDYYPLIFHRRGFQKTSISLPRGMFITFVYPSISKNIFEKIFGEQRLLIEKRLGGLIAMNYKNVLIEQSKVEMERLAFVDIETDLPNEHRLHKDILQKKKTIILIEVAGQSKIVETQGGQSDWTDIMQTVATFLRLESHADIYRYDKTTFCLVYESRFFSDAVLISEEGREDTIREFLHNLLSSFHANNGKNLQFYIGIVPEAEKEHLKLAHIALTEAKDPRREGIYVYQNGDEKHAEDVRYYTGILISAIDSNDRTARLVPHYQHIYDPKNPYIKKFEALVRIEYTDKDNSLTIIDPDNFIHIATYKRLLSEITSSMLHQILGDMKKDPELRVSINLHEQDWNDDRIMILLRQIGYGSGLVSSRINLEILETVPFDRDQDKLKIQELKSLGYKISIDDYGSGLATISNIISIDPDNIKIDKIIIEQLMHLQTRERAKSAIRSIVSHAKEIGATVTAEFVTTQEVFDLLQDLGVDFFQGYYFAKPEPFDTINTVK